MELANNIFSICTYYHLLQCSIILFFQIFKANKAEIRNELLKEQEADEDFIPLETPKSVLDRFKPKKKVKS